MTLYCSRIALRDDAAVGTLAGLLLPAEANASAAATHQLLWSLFTAADPHMPGAAAEPAQHAQRQRPAANFLWRDEGGEGWRRRRFLTLSAQTPDDRLRLFDVETKEFAPRFSVGQCLRFCLRANPSVSAPVRGAKRGKRKDPVAIALKSLPQAERRQQRFDILQREGRRWLAGQSERAGFWLPQGAPFAVDGEDHRVVARPPRPALARDGQAPIRFSVLDFSGVLEVRDPDAFLAAIARGFGRAKAFGCGLMLIRRA